MRALLLAALFISLAGCSLTPTQKKWAGFAAGVLVVGAIAAHDNSDEIVAYDQTIGGGPSCSPQPDGSCR
jgi:hypothetical protein